MKKAARLSLKRIRKGKARGFPRKVICASARFRYRVLVLLGLWEKAFRMLTTWQSAYLVGDIVVDIDPWKVKNLSVPKLRHFFSQNPFMYEYDTESVEEVRESECDRMMRELFVEGVKSNKTEFFKRCMEELRVSGVSSKGLRTEEDIENRYRMIGSLYEDMRKGGYKAQWEMGNAAPYDEASVFINESGKFVRIWGSGSHRFSLARLVGLQTMAFKIVGVHRKWVEEVVKRYETDPLRAIVIGIAECEGVCRLRLSEFISIEGRVAQSSSDGTRLAES